MSTINMKLGKGLLGSVHVQLVADWVGTVSPASHLRGLITSPSQVPGPWLNLVGFEAHECTRAQIMLRLSPKVQHRMLMRSGFGWILDRTQWHNLQDRNDQVG